MQTKTMNLLIVLGLAITSLACTQGEKQDQGETQTQGEELTQTETQTQGETPAQMETHDEAVEGHSQESSELHGGSVIMTPKHHFEVVFGSEEVRVYGYDGAHKPISEMMDAGVALTLQKTDGDPEELALSYVGPDAESGRKQGYFAAPYKFGDVEEGQIKATFLVSSMAKEPITFEAAVRVSEPVTYACPMHAEITGEDPIECSVCGMLLTKQEQSDHDTTEH